MLQWIVEDVWGIEMERILEREANSEDIKGDDVYKANYTISGSVSTW